MSKILPLPGNLSINLVGKTIKEFREIEGEFSDYVEIIFTDDSKLEISFSVGEYNDYIEYTFIDTKKGIYV